MLLQEHQSLDELTLHILVDRPGATAKEVWQALEQKNHSYSLRGVYKELRKLEEQGILFKRGETYNVRLAWITNLLSFGDRAYEQYTGSEYLATALGADDAKLTERFNNLQKLDRFWTQLILTLHNIYPQETMCLWCPYQWFYLAHLFTAKQFYQALNLAGHKRLHIIGNDSFLGRLALEDLPKGGHYSFAKSPFDSERSTYYTVIGDSVLTVKLAQNTTDAFRKLFGEVTKKSDIRAENLAALFAAKTKATLVLERNELKAQRLKKKFADYFGVQI